MVSWGRDIESCGGVAMSYRLDWWNAGRKKLQISECIGTCAPRAMLLRSDGYENETVE